MVPYHDLQYQDIASSVDLAAIRTREQLVYMCTNGDIDAEVSALPTLFPPVHSSGFAAISAREDADAARIDLSLGTFWQSLSRRAEPHADFFMVFLGITVPC